jgi:hypothetical protein
MATIAAYSKKEHSEFVALRALGARLKRGGQFQLGRPGIGNYPSIPSGLLPVVPGGPRKVAILAQMVHI